MSTIKTNYTSLHKDQHDNELYITNVSTKINNKLLHYCQHESLIIRYCTSTRNVTDTLIHENVTDTLILFSTAGLLVAHSTAVITL